MQFFPQHGVCDFRDATLLMVSDVPRDSQPSQLESIKQMALTQELMLDCECSHA